MIIPTPSPPPDAQITSTEAALLQERDALRANVNELKERCAGWHTEYWIQRRRAETAELNLRLKQTELHEVQQAAETYHAAWQDACVYWKDKLAEARDVARELLEIGSWGRVQQLFRKRYRWMDDE